MLDPCLLIAFSRCVVLPLLYSILMNQLVGITRARTVKASLLVFFALIALVPILRALTAPTSADSIWVLAFKLFLVHAALTDYSYRLSSPARVVRPSSLFRVCR